MSIASENGYALKWQLAGAVGFAAVVALAVRLVCFVSGLLLLLLCVRACVHVCMCVCLFLCFTSVVLTPSIVCSVVLISVCQSFACSLLCFRLSWIHFFCSILKEEGQERLHVYMLCSLYWLVDLLADCLSGFDSSRCSRSGVVITGITDCWKAMW